MERERREVQAAESPSVGEIRARRREEPRPPYELTDADLIRHFREQVSFLRTSASAFDDGREAEARRLAITLRVLLHDAERGPSRALLTQLGILNKVAFVDTTIPPPPNDQAPRPGTVQVRIALFRPGLVTLRMAADGSRYVAPLDSHGSDRPRSFDEWWNEKVSSDSYGNEFSRRDWVLSVANKDGGGHVDSTIPGPYRQISAETHSG